MSSSRGWMYKRAVNGSLTEEFIRGVDEFLKFAFAQTKFMSGDKIRCPCRKCKDMAYQNRDDATFHLYKNGFMLDYEEWVDHGEELIQRPLIVHKGGVTEQIGGPVPVITHKKRMVAFVGMSPEVFKKTHTQKGIDESVDARAKKSTVEVNQIDIASLPPAGNISEMEEERKKNSLLSELLRTQTDEIFGLKAELERLHQEKGDVAAKGVEAAKEVSKLKCELEELQSLKIEIAARDNASVDELDLSKKANLTIRSMIKADGDYRDTIINDWRSEMEKNINLCQSGLFNLQSDMTRLKRQIWPGIGEVPDTHAERRVHDVELAYIHAAKKGWFKNIIVHDPEITSWMPRRFHEFQMILLEQAAGRTTTSTPTTQVSMLSDLSGMSRLGADDPARMAREKTLKNALDTSDPLITKHKGPAPKG